jgi:hypothetical protein
MKSIAKKFNLREKLIETELNSALARQKEKQVVSNISAEQKSEARNLNYELKISSPPERENPYEKELVKLLFSGSKEIIEHIIDSISLDDISNHKLRQLADMVKEGYYEQRFSPSYIIEQIENEDDRNFILGLTLSDETISKKWDELSFSGKIEKDTIDHAKEMVKNFLLYNIDLQIKENNRIIGESKDDKLNIEIMKRIKDLQEGKKIITSSNNNTKTDIDEL